MECAIDASMDVPYVEVYDEPLHPTVLNNDYVRVLKVDCPANQDTMFHRHSQDSFFLFFRTAKIRNEVVGKEPFEAELEAGSFYWGDHLLNPIIHKVCVGHRGLDCMDVEIKADRPKPSSLRLPLPDTAARSMCFESDVMRAYRIEIAPGQDVQAVLARAEGSAVEFPYLAVAMNKAKLLRGDVEAGDRWWCHEGSEGSVRETNDGDDKAEFIIIEPK